MNIALVLMPWYRRESPAPDFAITASILRKQGHKVFVYDVNNLIFNDEFLLRSYWKFFLLDATENAENEFFDLTKDIFDYYASKILALEPQIIIFKIIGRTHSNSVKMAEVIKEKNKDRVIIFSGALASSKEIVDSFAQRQEKSPFDYIICGEDEVALPELLKSLESRSQITLKRDGKVIDCTDGPWLENLDSLPFYDFSDFDLGSYKFPEKLEMFISRGCPWRCSFCIDWMTEKKYRSMGGERIFREVQYQMSKYKVKHVRFCDKTINGDIKAIDEFCDLMLKSYKEGSFFMSWSGDAMIRPEMTAGLLQKMHSAGCGGLGYGLESGSERVVRDMGKQFTIPLAQEVIRNTRNAGIFTSVNILVGFPTETEENFRETVSFVEANSEFIDEIRLTFVGCRIYRHSILYKQPERFNLVNTDTDNWSTKDGLNTYEERVKRYEAISRRILDLGIELRVNSRTTKKVIKA